MWKSDLTVTYPIFLAVMCNVCWCSRREEPPPTYLSSSVGGYVPLNCDFEFPQDIPIPYSITWNKEGKRIFSMYNGMITAEAPYVGRVRLIENRLPNFGKASLNLTSIRDTDGGWYQCKITFPNRIPSSINNGTWIFLTVNEGNLLAIPPINQTVLEGDKVNFTCISKDADTKISWYKDGSPLSQNLDIYHRSELLPEGTLIIKQSAMGDTGEYECEALDYKGDVQSAKAYLNVQYKAKVIFTPKEVYLPYDQPAVLDCHFRANPPLTNLRWEKDGFLFDPLNVPGVFYKQNGSLYFDRVDETHNGNYSCTPYNDLGTDGPSPNILVTVLRSPTFTITPHHLYLRKLGQDVEFFCDAIDGENGHKPSIIWYRKDGLELPEGRYAIQDGSLTIRDIQGDDRGLYQCSATNEAATISAEAELLVENFAPRAPYNITGVVSENSVRLKWVSGRKRPKIKYSVWYRLVNAPEWRKVDVYKTIPSEVTIYNLIPGREYDFMVLSEDPHDDSLISKPLRVKTLGYTPEGAEGMHYHYRIGPPSNITFNISTRGYIVQWSPPEYGVDNLDHYLVKWHDVPAGHLIGTAESKNTSYLVTNLEEGATYDFSISAIAYGNYQSAPIVETFVVPPFKKLRLLSFGLMATLALLVIVVTVIYFVKSKKSGKSSQAETKS